MRHKPMPLTGLTKLTYLIGSCSANLCLLQHTVKLGCVVVEAALNSHAREVLIHKGDHRLQLQSRRSLTATKLVGT